jgi:hypothetical protein
LEKKEITEALYWAARCVEEIKAPKVLGESDYIGDDTGNR